MSTETKTPAVAPSDASLFAALPCSVRERLLLHGSRRTFADGTWLHRRGDTDRQLSIVIRGAVQLSNLGRDGRNVVIATLAPGDSFGEFPLFAGSPRFFDFRAVGETDLCVIGAATLEQLMSDDASVATAIITLLANRLQLALEIIDDERRLSLPARTAKALLRQPRDSEATDRITVTQHTLADELGVSRVALGKALTRLRQLGLVETGYGYIRIPDDTQIVKWLVEQSPIVAPLSGGRRRLLRQ
ncbi:MAG: Crp/Fnr family transcriptional regulator [Pseudomonadota bacterium]